MDCRSYRLPKSPSNYDLGFILFGDDIRWPQRPDYATYRVRGKTIHVSHPNGMGSYTFWRAHFSRTGIWDAYSQGDYNTKCHVSEAGRKYHFSESQPHDH